MAVNMTTFAAALKTLYPKDVMKNLAYQKNPFLGLVPKDENAIGDSVKVPMIIAPPAGNSITFATAVANKGASTLKAFTLTRVSDYSIVSIGREVMLASEGDMGAFVAARKVEIDMGVHAASRSLAKQLYGDGSGAIGQISAASNVATATITLADINDVTNFEVGMVLQACATKTGSSAKSGTVTISGVDRNLGTLTASGNWSAGIGTVAASDYLYRSGDYDGALKGLAAWCPATAPTSTAFFGVDRTADVTRLGGVRHDGSSQTVEEAIIDAARKVTREGGQPDYLFMNPVQVSQLVKSLGSKVIFDHAKSPDGDVGFKTIKVYTPAGEVQVVSDFNCPAQYAWLVQLDSWKLYSVGPTPSIFDLDNDQKLLREASSDGYELRIGGYHQLGCKAPGWNAIITLAAAT